MPQSYIPDGRTDAFQIPEYQDIADAVEAFQAFADTCAHTDELIDHVADTTSVHGIADTSTLVTTNGSQTLTNKTLAAPTISNGATVTGTVTGVLQPSIVDAKGDLIVGTAADTAGRLAAGSNGQYLKADSSTATGLTWATQSPHAIATARLTVTGLSVAVSDSISILGTINWPSGRFSQTPVVVITSNEDSLAAGSYKAIFTSSDSTSSSTVSFANANSSTTITKLSINAVAVQMTSGSATG